MLNKLFFVLFQNGITLPTDPEESEALDEDEDVRVLQEMFPAAMSLEIAHCLCVANGNMEQAAQLILHREEVGESIKTMGNSVSVLGFAVPVCDVLGFLKSLDMDFSLMFFLGSHKAPNINLVKYKLWKLRMCVNILPVISIN